MGFWNRRADRRAPASFMRHRKLDDEGITSAAVRYDLTREADVKALAKAQQQWQMDAWHWVDVVGPAQYAERFIANSFRRIRLFAAFQRDPQGQPIAVGEAVRPTDAAADLPSGEEVADVVADPDEYLDPKWAELAEQHVRDFASRDGGQGALMERLGVNLFVPGECYLVNREVLARRPVEVDDPVAVGGRRMERLDEVPRVRDWEVRSADEIRKSPRQGANGVDLLMVVDSPDQRDGVDLAGEDYVERVWRKHGRWSGWADSNFRAAIGDLELLDLLGRVARASVRSRLVAGFVTFPDELDFGAADKPAGEGSGAPSKKVSLDREIVELFTSVIGDESDPNTVAPAPIRGPKEFLDGIRHVEIPRRYGGDEAALAEATIKNLARTLDLPVEVLLGMADLNHWTAWQVDEATYEAHIEPLAMVATEALTYGYLRPMMLEDGCPPEVVERLVVEADPSDLVRRPDRGKTATEGHGLFALSDEAWRRANGFGDDDAPSDDELRRRLAVARSILTAELSVLLLEQAGLMPAGTAEKMAAAKAPAAAPVEGETPADDAGTEEEPGAPDAEARAAVTAAAARIGTAQSLALADRVLRERLLATFDASMTRAVDRAGARLRTRASRVGPARERLNAAGTVPNHEVGRVLGELAATLASDSDLLDGAFDDLHDRFDSWVGDTQAAALDTVEHFAGDGFTTAMRSDVEAAQAEDRNDAWAWLLAALTALAAARIRGAEMEPSGDAGEYDPAIVVPPGLVRQALAIAGGEAVEQSAGGGVITLGGEPVGGPSTGQTVRRLFAELGFPWAGYVWNYGLAPRQHPFEPHRALGGREFATWTDPVLANEAGQWPGVPFWRPGDHRYCRCDFAPVIAEAAAAAAYPASTPPVED